MLLTIRRCPRSPRNRPMELGLHPQSQRNRPNYQKPNYPKPHSFARTEPAFVGETVPSSVEVELSFSTEEGTVSLSPTKAGSVLAKLCGF